MLAFVVLISGCTASVNPFNFKYDAINLENYAVSTVSPYAGGAVKIEFDVTSNTNTPVENVEINFFDMTGFTIVNLKCNGVDTKQSTCLFDKMSPLDSRKVSMTLQAPSEDVIKAPTYFTISFYVKYRHQGSRIAQIPIIDGVLIKQPSSQYSTSSPSWSPIVATFQPPLGRETQRGKQVIKEYWGIKGEPFEVKIDFKDMSDKSVNSPITTNISASDISLHLDGLTISSDLPCSLGKEEISVPTDKAKTVSCNFISGAKNEPEWVGVIELTYKYNYQFIRKQSITVNPIE